MRLGMITVSIIVIAMAGCMQPGSKANAPSPAHTPIPAESCPSDELRRDVYADAGAFVEERLFVDVAGTMRLEGTMEGDIGTFIVAADPIAKSLRFSGPDAEVRVVGPYFSIDVDDEGEVTAAYGRNHQPGAMFDQFMEEFGRDEEEPSFADDLTVDDYEATCTEQGGVQVIEYRYGYEGLKSVTVAERDGLHRPLSGEQVDPALQDNFRASISYEPPTILVDDTLDRMPVTWGFDVINSNQNSRGGIYALARLDDRTEWAPLAELEVRLVAPDDGTVYFSERLASKEYDMADGDVFGFNDEDANGKLSKGDTFYMDLGPGLDIQLYDQWADAYVLVTA